MDAIVRQILEIVVRSRNDAAAGLLAAGAEVKTFQAGLTAAGKTAIGVGGALTLAAAGLAVGTGALVDEASKYQTLLSTIQGNTVLTNQQVAVMSAGIQKLATGTGAPLDQLAQGFQHISNVGFSAADSMKILTAANESALSTGSQTSDVANVLGMQMHEFGIKASEAAKAMNVLHLAAAESNTTLDTFVTSTSKATAMAANLGVSFVDANAALSALGRHMDISQASTAFAGEMVKIVASSKGAQKILADLTNKTGIPLTTDFTSAGLAAKGFTQVSDDLARATGGNASEMLKLIAATRGGLSALVLAGTGAKDYNNVLSDLSATMAGKTDPTSVAFARQQGTLAAQMAKVHENVVVLAVTLGTVLLPPITAMVQAILPVIARFREWATAHADLIAHTLPLVAAITGIIGVALLAGGAIALLVTAFNPVRLAIVLAIAAVELLGIAWATNFGGMRTIIENVQRAVIAFLPTLRDIAQALIYVGEVFVIWRVGAAAVALYVRANEALLFMIWAVRGGFIQLAFATAVAAAQSALQALWAAASAIVMGVVRAATVAWRIATEALTFALVAARSGGILFAAGAIAVAIASTVVRGATMAWMAAQWLLNAAMDANPLGLLIIAIAAVTAGVIWAYQNVGWFHDIINKVWSFISSTLGPALGGLAHFFGDILGGAISWAFDLLKKFLDLLSHIPGISLPKVDASSADMSSLMTKAGKDQNAALQQALQQAGGTGAGLAAAPTTLAPSALNTLNITPFRNLTAPLVTGPSDAALATSLAAGTPSSTPAIPSLTGTGSSGPAAAPININVTVAADAVNITTADGKATGDLRDYGMKVGEQIADALAKFARGGISVEPGAPALVPGGRS